MKTLIKIIVGIVLFVVVALLALPLWIGPVAKGIAGAVVPGKTQTDFELKAFELNPYTGHLLVGEMRLGNPAGFSPENAVALGRLDVSVDVGSAFSDVVIVRHVIVSDVFVSYVFSRTGEANFSVIMNNVKGAPKEDAQDAAKQPATEQKPDDGKAGKKVILDLVQIENVVVQMGPLKVPLPPIALKEIGRDSGGTTWNEAWQKVSAEVMRNVGALGGNIKDASAALQALGIKTTKGATDAVCKGADAALDVTGKGANAAVGVTKDALNKTTDAATDAVNKDADAATKALKGLFK